MARLKIALVQMRCEKAGLDENLREMERHIREAAARGVDIVGFPEASLTGFADPTKHPRAVIRRDGPEMAAVLAMTRGHDMTVLPGFIEANPAGKPFVTQAVVRDGRVIGYHRKQFIIEEEDEWFTPGERIATFRHGGLGFGIAICADLTTEAVYAVCARRGACIVFHLAAPGLYGDRASRDWRAGYEWWEGVCRKYFEGYARKYGIWIAVATQAGRTCDEDFPGGGYVFAPDGRRLYATPDGSAGAVYLELDMGRQKVREI
jgi:predicted amidohydrolase